MSDKSTVVRWCSECKDYTSHRQAYRLCTQCYPKDKDQDIIKDLLEACKSIRKALDADPQIKQRDYYNERIKLDAAIAKAEKGE